MDALRAALGPHTAGIMLTNPSTLGVFERRITEISELVHAAGGLLYYDGANLNAILGRALPGDMGFDAIHMNLHKTFSTPHGGGGPGAGAVGVSERLEPFLPAPIVVEEQGRYRWADEEERDQSIGRLSAFMGNAGILLRAYVYMRLLGAEGMRRVADHAALNANYLARVLADAGFRLAYPERRASHEFIRVAQGSHQGDRRDRDGCGQGAAGQGFPRADHLLSPAGAGVPADSSRPRPRRARSWDAFADALIEIRDQARSDPDAVKAAPVSMPVRRLDDVRAARQLDVAWRSGA